MNTAYKRRDAYVARICNALLKLASKNYQDTIAGIFEYGIDSAARDVIENRNAPKHWTEYAPGD